MSRRDLFVRSSRTAAGMSVDTKSAYSCRIVPVIIFTVLVAPILWAQPQVPATTSTAPTTGIESPQESLSTPATTRPSDRAIPLPQIADRAEELDRWLREITSRLTPEADLLKAEEQAKSKSAELRKHVIEVDDLLASGPTTLERQSEQRFWRVLSQKYATELESLTPRAAELEKQIRLLDEQQLDWEATWDQIQQRTEIETVVKRTGEELIAIRNARTALEKQLNLVLTYSSRTAVPSGRSMNFAISTKR
jgi:potassium efflux system protein